MAPVITALGIITPLGCDCKETFAALIEGKFIACDSVAKMSDGQGGNVCELALAAARQAIGQAGWGKWPDDTAIVVGTSKGDIESWLAAMDKQRGLGRKESRAVPGPRLDAMFPWGNRFGLGNVAANLARELDAPDAIRLTYSAACASGIHALARAVMMIRAGEVKRALVVAAECSLHPLFQGCFDNLGVRAQPGEPSKPFDRDRGGFHISQAAAAVCLEAGGLSDKSSVAIDEIAIAGDAWHITGNDPTAMTLRKMLRKLLRPAPVEFIHAHGTATMNDEIELNAIETEVGSQDPRPIVYSHKGAIGHSLGASGLAGVVINCLVHQSGIVPGNVGLKNALRAEKITLIDRSIEQGVKRSIVLAGGFGGALAGVALRSI